MDIVVPGVLPIGCFPIYLTIFQSSNQGDYDQIGCLKKFNDLSSYHNKLLKQALSKLQSKYSSTRIMYGDYYDQVYQMVQSPQSFGKFYFFLYIESNWFVPAFLTYYIIYIIIVWITYFIYFFFI